MKRIIVTMLIVLSLIMPTGCYAATAKHSTKPNDDFFSMQKKQFDLVSVREVWSKKMYGKYKKRQPVVAIIDTGVTKHLDIKNILKGKGISGSKISTRYSDIDYQGTSIAGIIAATNNNKIGISGLMPDAVIYPLKIFKVGDYGELTASQSSLATAINNAVAKKVDVINLSVQTPLRSSKVEKAIKLANDNNIIVVASCGDTGDDTVMYPAAYDGVVSVSAITDKLAKQEYSNYNSEVDVTAPGQNIPCTVPTGSVGEQLIGVGYSLNCGTAYSAAYVSALAAMYKAIKPGGGHDDFMGMLEETCFDLGKIGKDSRFGWGLIDFANAYSYLVGPQNCNHKYGKWKTLVKKSARGNGLESHTCKKCLFTQKMYVLN